jgi:predicted GIY-YIG superfamily endonuclease
MITLGTNRMPERQLKLFPTRNSLCERFPPDFFRGVPREPGVYFMSDAERRIIYVGKARDLRQRLSSYRYAHEECSRKTARLTVLVAQIRWQICDSEEEALLEENRLLREWRPRFNRVNTWPKASRFIRLNAASGAIDLALSADADNDCFGAFKGASRQNFGALLRLLWTAMNKAGYGELPRTLLLERSPVQQRLPFIEDHGWQNRLRGFLLGECEELLGVFLASASSEGSVFHSTFRQADLLAIEHFYRIGPQRNHRLRQRFGNGKHLIAQHDLDDWLVRDRKRQLPEGNANAT